MKTTIKKPRLATSQELTQAERIVLSNFRLMAPVDADFFVRIAEKIGARSIPKLAQEDQPRLQLVHEGRK